MHDLRKAAEEAHFLLNEIPKDVMLKHNQLRKASYLLHEALLEQSHQEPMTQQIKILKRVIESHCEDLEKCAFILSEHTEFKETVSEIRLAVKELKEAMQQQAQVQQKPYAYVEKNNGLRRTGSCTAYYAAIVNTDNMIPLYKHSPTVRRLSDGEHFGIAEQGESVKESIYGDNPKSNKESNSYG